MTYRINKLDNPHELIDRQDETIADQRRQLIEASKQIAKLKTEKADLIDALNKASRPVNMRADQNWDGGFRAEISE